MSRAMRSIKRRALVSALTLLVAGSVVTSTPAGGGRALGAPPVHTEPVAGAVDASSPSQPDQTRANARDLYAHLRITFAGKDAFRENLLLRGPMFYEAVDRPDLAARYRELESRKNMVAFLSSLTLGAGVVWGALDLTIAKTDAHVHRSPTLIPWAIAIAGLAGIIVSTTLPLEPVPEQERQALARDQNRKTAARLGADPDEPAGPR